MIDPGAYKHFKHIQKIRCKMASAPRDPHGGTLITCLGITDPSTAH